MIIVVGIALIIVVAALPYTFKTSAMQYTTKSLKEGFKSDVSIDNDQFSNSSNTSDAAWASIQYQLECCGAVNYSDYSSFKWTRFTCTNSNDCPANNTGDYVVPMSCCKLTDGGHIPTSMSEFTDLPSCLTAADESSTNNIGCAIPIVDTATDFINDYTGIIVGVFSVIVVIEVILVGLTFLLCCKKKSPN